MIAAHHQVGNPEYLFIPFLWQPYTNALRSGVVHFLNIEIGIFDRSLFFPVCQLIHSNFEILIISVTINV